MRMMKKYATIYDKHLERTAKGEYCNHSVSPHAAPIHATPYRAEPRQLQLGKKVVEQMSSASAAEPVATKWALSILSVTKKHEIVRFCVTYHRLNALTICDSYLQIDECIGSFRIETFFSRLDANSSSLQVRMNEKDADKMAFVAHREPYRYQ